MPIERLDRMQQDITASDIYQAAESLMAAALAAGSGRIFDIAELALSPDGRTIAASGSVIDRLAYAGVALINRGFSSADRQNSHS